MFGGGTPSASHEPRLTASRRDGLEQPARAEADRVVRRQAGFRGHLGDRDLSLLPRRARTCSRRSPPPGRVAPAARSARAARPARAGEAADVRGSPRPRSRPPCGRARTVRRRAVHQPERHARVGRVRERALALDEEQLAAAPGSLDDEPLGRAGEEVGDDRVDGDSPAGDRDPGLAGRHELTTARPRRRASRSSSTRDRLLADRAVRADGEHDRRRHLEVLARRHAEIGRRLAQVAQLDAVAQRRARLSSGSSETGTRAGRSRRRGPRRCSSSAARARRAGSGRPGWPRRRSPCSGRSRARRSTVATTGMPSIVSPARVESSTATTGVGR